TDWPKDDGTAELASVVVVSPLRTASINTAEMLPLKFPSPLYCAVIACPPTDRLEVVSAALPSAASVTTPSVTVPSLNVAVPVGVPNAGATTVTVAVNVTDWPKSDGLAELVKLKLVPPGPPVSPLFTVCVKTAETLP